jgi:hypothetical protein
MLIVPIVEGGINEIAPVADPDGTIDGIDMIRVIVSDSCRNGDSTHA